MKNKMKVVFCIGSMSKGGAERVVSILSKYFSENEKVSIITSVNNKIEYELDANIEVISLDGDDRYKNRIDKIIKRRKKLKKVLKNIKPDIIISFLPEPSFRVLSLKKYIGAPIIVSVRNDPKVEYDSLLYKICMKILYRKADGFVFQTKEAQQYFSKKIRNKSTIIPNPVEDRFLLKPFDGERDKIIVSVGRIEAQKNQLMLIKAFANLDEKYKDYKLIIFGDGKLKPQLEQEIEKLDLKERILLPGKVDNLIQKIYKSSLFVLSSNYEGMPNSLLEALGIGIPCISTDCPCGGPREIKNKGIDLLLVSTQNTEQLTKAIRDVLDNKVQMDLNKNTNIIKNNYNVEKIASEWYDYIKRIKQIKK